MWYHLPVPMGENCGLIPGIGIRFFSGAQPMGERDVLEVKEHEASPSSHPVLRLGMNEAVSPHPHMPS